MLKFDRTGEANRIEKLIKEGKIDEAHATGNLVELKPFSERQVDAMHFIQDDGNGGKSAKNNREYGLTTNKDGTRRKYVGDVRDPAQQGATVTVMYSKNTVTDDHTHPSGTNGNSYFYPQAPSSSDINDVPPGSQPRTVWRRGTKLVYIYNEKGVIAVLPTNRYLQKH